MGDLSVVVPGGARYLPGRTYVLFLADRPLPGSSGELSAPAHSQGVFEVVHARDGFRAISQATSHPLSGCVRLRRSAGRRRRPAARRDRPANPRNRGAAGRGRRLRRKRRCGDESLQASRLVAGCAAAMVAAGLGDDRPSAGVPHDPAAHHRESDGRLPSPMQRPGRVLPIGPMPIPTGTTTLPIRARARTRGALQRHERLDLRARRQSQPDLPRPHRRRFLDRRRQCGFVGQRPQLRQRMPGADGARGVRPGM